MNLEKLKVHHIGYLVKNIDKARERFLSLGFTFFDNHEIFFDEIRNIKICFMEKDGYIIELVSSANENSIVGELHKKIGNSPYHICYEVEDLEKAIMEFRKEKYIIWEEPNIAPALENKNVVFLFNSHVGIVELVENKMTN